MRARDRSILRVLVVVEKDAVALFFPPFARRETGRPALDLAGQGQRGPADVIERPARFDPYVDVQTAGARRFRPADKAEVVQAATEALYDPHRPDIETMQRFLDGLRNL